MALLACHFVSQFITEGSQGTQEFQRKQRFKIETMEELF